MYNIIYNIENIIHTYRTTKKEDTNLEESKHVYGRFRRDREGGMT